MKYTITKLKKTIVTYLDSTTLIWRKGDIVTQNHIDVVKSLSQKEDLIVDGKFEIASGIEIVTHGRYCSNQCSYLYTMFTSCSLFVTGSCENVQHTELCNTLPKMKNRDFKTIWNPPRNTIYRCKKCLKLTNN